MDLSRLPTELQDLIQDYLWDVLCSFYRINHRRHFRHVLSDIAPKADIKDVFEYYLSNHYPEQKRLILRMHEKHGFRMFHWYYQGCNLLERAYFQSNYDVWNLLRSLGARYSNVSKRGFYINKYSQGRPWHIDR